MKILFCEHPKQPLVKKGYCSYYGEIFYALKEVVDIDFVSHSPSRLSELGNDYDAIILGFAHTCVGERAPKPVINDSQSLVFPILNKEYAALDKKLQWIKNMKPTAALTVQYRTKEYTEATEVPFHRIMWSADHELFKDYGHPYAQDLFYSGVVRKNQTNNWRYKIFKNLDRLSQYKLLINARYEHQGYSGNILTPGQYARAISSSKLVFSTLSPADIVNPRYFETMASNRSLLICNKVSDDRIYKDMLVDGENCIMFDGVDDFFNKAEFFLNNDDERMKIVNSAYSYFCKSQTWKHRAEKILDIIKQYKSK